MKYAKFIGLGIVFGFILTKSEIISWYRWQEMFRFESFQLYGVMLSAAFIGAAGVALIKKFKIRDITGRPIVLRDKAPGFYRYAIGGFFFGLGWVFAGCPGTQYTLMGRGYPTLPFILLSMVTGTWFYGRVMHKLPH